MITQKNCEGCEKLFIDNGKYYGERKFCSPKCRRKYYHKKSYYNNLSIKSELSKNAVKTGKCLGCGNKFVDLRNGNVIKKRFCSEKCRTRYNANLAYQKIKNDPKYKKYAKKKFKNWLKNNKEHFNDLVREKNKLHQRKIRKEREEKKLCRKCGKISVKNTKYHNCEECRKKREIKNIT